MESNCGVFVDGFLRFRGKTTMVCSMGRYVKVLHNFRSYRFMILITCTTRLINTQNQSLQVYEHAELDRTSRCCFCCIYVYIYRMSFMALGIYKQRYMKEN